jgi:hypothetical protein
MFVCSCACDAMIGQVFTLVSELEESGKPVQDAIRETLTDPLAVRSPLVGHIMAASGY